MQFAATYTYSHALANNLGEGGAPQDPTNLRRDYGNADDDVRHYLVVQGLYEPKFSDPRLHWINGLEISSMAFYNSGYPINAVSGIDLNNDGNLNDRPLFRGRNHLAGDARQGAARCALAPAASGRVGADRRFRRSGVVRRCGGRGKGHE